MNHLIDFRLTEIEAENNIKIVYACESGSRAWGFPSANSDYDVRFLYIRPIEWYLSISEKRDVIEYPINEQLDISGWDLKKALYLLQKSNPTLLEWLGSPIVYIEKSSVAEKMRQYAKEHYSLSVCLYHYFSMARGNFGSHQQGDIVRLKKYFYVLRPILAMKWLEEGRGIVPTDFNIILNELLLPAELKEEINKLLLRKLAGDELDKGEKNPVISNFIESEIERWERTEIRKAGIVSQFDELDELFRESIKEVWELKDRWD